MEAEVKICPDCGGTMVIKRNSRTNHKFMGCSNYPSCTRTEQTEDEPDDSLELPSNKLRNADRRRWE